MKNKRSIDLSYSEIFYKNFKNFFSIKILKHDIIATTIFAVIIFLYACLLDFFGRSFPFTESQIILWSMLPSCYILTFTYVGMQSFMQYLEWDHLKSDEKFSSIAKVMFIIYLLIVGTIFIVIVSNLFENKNYIGNFCYYWFIIYFLKKMNGLIPQ